jgi:hypothetical protein
VRERLLKPWREMGPVQKHTGGARGRNSKWIVTGEHSTGKITILIATNNYNTDSTPLATMGTRAAPRP